MKTNPKPVFKLSTLGMIRTCRSRGLTLVELLVVIAIIAVLVAVAIPVTISMRKKGNIVLMTANMRTLATLMGTYATDNNGYFPWGEDPKIPGGRGSWKYVTLESADMIEGEAPLIMDGPLAPKKIKVLESGNYLASAYSGNVSVLGNPGGLEGKGFTQRVAIHQIVNPARTAIFMTGAQVDWPWDGSASTIIYSPWTNTVEASNGNDKLPESALKENHGQVGFWMEGKAAMAMVDGHVELIKKSEMKWGYLQTGKKHWYQQ